MMRHIFFRNPVRTNRLLFILCLLFFFGACTGIQSGMASADMNEALKNAATNYWKLRMEDRYEETYKMEDKEGLPPFQNYIFTASAMKKFNVVSHTIRDVHAEKNSGTVTVEISFIMPPVSKPFKKIIEDKWVYSGGEWRHIFSP